MDSLTQITLGAAMGELTLGKKIGNRAMIWGAIAGTIPDLDVLAGIGMSEIDALAFHRGPTHSLLFAFTTPWLFAWLADRWYAEGHHAGRPVRVLRMILRGAATGAVAVGLLWLASSRSMIWAAATTIPLLAAVYFLLPWVRRPLIASAADPPDAEYRDWVRLFFWAILTHPILDAFTSYGTQLFLPFSDVRVAFNAIAVVDPIYTIPFLGALILAARLTRDSVTRRKLVLFGVIWSTVYLGLCSVNKLHVDRIFARSLEEQGIEATRFTISPSIFNNVLWSGVAETPTHFYLGSYSLFDTEAKITDLVPLEKRSPEPEAILDDPTWKILRWFSNGYFLTEPMPGGTYNFYDLRYGGMPGRHESHSKRFIFSFNLEQGPLGWVMKQNEPERREVAGSFSALWTRLKGNSTGGFSHSR